jgi:hypothetical protein
MRLSPNFQPASGLEPTVMMWVKQSVALYSKIRYKLGGRAAIASPWSWRQEYKD